LPGGIRQKNGRQEQQAGAAGRSRNQETGAAGRSSRQEQENQEAGAAGRDRKKQKRLSNQFLLLLAAPASWFSAPILSALAQETVDV